MTREAEILLNQEHKEIQVALYHLLVAEFGAEKVDAEHHIKGLGYVDIAALTANGWVYYEIKVAQDLKSCIRQALGQLLEYGYWAHAGRCERMVIVSRFPLDEDGQAYLALLRQKYNLPLEYRQVTV
ncbi:MAG: hypothetical protein IPL96_07225 [Holophagaceae bacterium]|nr:hypothetical protein [Holophagaceae bacterium]